MTMLDAPPLRQALASVGILAVAIGIGADVARAASPSPSGKTEDAAAAPATKPATAVKPAKQWPVLPSQRPASVTAAWTEIEIKAAQARCVEVLKGLDIVAVGASPLRESGGCGSPAPVELISVGKNPQVTFSPTVTVTCDLAAALHNWVRQDVQPLAKKFLGAPVIRIDTMSSYSCRNAYGRARTRLSEHGRANAIDIRGFATASAEMVEVINAWGLTSREIQAQVAAAKAEAAKSAVAKAAPIPQKAVSPTEPNRSVATGTLKPSLDNGAPSTALAPGGAPTQSSTGVSVGIPGLSIGLPSIGRGTTNNFGEPNRLGGPKREQDSAQAQSNRTQFMRQAHATACRIFGTVLGPEANNAHKNHFHLDMAERATSNFCE